MLVETTLNYNQQQRESGAVSDTVQRQGHTLRRQSGTAFKCSGSSQAEIVLFLAISTFFQSQ